MGEGLKHDELLWWSRCGAVLFLGDDIDILMNK